MLVLTSRINQTLVIAGNIEVTVLQIGNGRVQLGITAPRDVKILRRELQDPPVTEI